MCVPSGSRKFPGLGVGVIERVPEDHLEVHVGGAMHECVDVPSRRLDARTIGERRARDQAHREHSSPRQLGIRRRDDDVGFVGEVRREALEVRVAPATGRWRRAASPRTRRRSPWDAAAPARDPRARDRSAIASMSSRSSRTRCSTPSWRTFTATAVPSCSVARCTCATDPDAKGSGLERAVEIATRSRRARVRPAPVRHPVGSGGDRRLQLRQLHGDVVADDIGSQAQHLTELDPRRAELGQRPPQPLTVRHRDDLGVGVVGRRGPS